MGFAETYGPNCAAGKRVFHILANGANWLSNVDVFVGAGACHRAYTPTKPMTADASGNIAITLVPVKENPFVSFINIVSAV